MWTQRWKREWLTLLVIGGMLVLLVYISIEHLPKQTYVYPPLSFRIDETLLGASVEDSTLNMRMSMPKGWHRINQVTFSHVFGAADKRFQQAHERGVLQYIFWQQEMGAASVVIGSAHQHRRNTTKRGTCVC